MTSLKAGLGGAKQFYWTELVLRKKQLSYQFGLCHVCCHPVPASAWRSISCFPWHLAMQTYKSWLSIFCPWEHQPMSTSWSITRLRRTVPLWSPFMCSTTNLISPFLCRCLCNFLQPQNHLSHLHSISSDHLHHPQFSSSLHWQPCLHTSTLWILKFLSLNFLSNTTEYITIPWLLIFKLPTFLDKI